MSAANSQFSFQLPSLSYVDASWEEPNLRTPATARKPDAGGWLSRQINKFVAWRRDSEAARELSAMSDRELLDFGLSRGDIGRVFQPAFNEDLRRRGART
jgi:uncharacterized protein YjiS (DUF1127 family)